MTAIAFPAGPTTFPAGPTTPRARIRLAPGPEAPVRHRRYPAAVYRRRRVATLLLVVGTALGGHAVLDVLGGGPLTAAEAPPSGARVVDIATKPVAKATYVVRSGDTLWTIARRVQPAGDVRPLVDALAASRDGRPLQPGERIVLP